MKKKSADVSPVTQQLSAYIASALKKPLPKAVVERAKLHTLDTFAAIVAGSRLAPGKKALAYVKSLGGKPQAGILGTRLLTSLPAAALVNGMFAHADELDDTHPASLTHPGRNVVPAALAIGEHAHHSGTALLRAIVLGYDICARMMLALKAIEFQRTGHYSGAFGGAFGATAAAAALLKLDARQTRFALSYCGQQAAGLAAVLRDPEHIQKSFAGCGMPAHNGIVAALVASHGFTGVEDVFSGERDFFYAFEPAAERAELVRDLGRDFKMLTSAIKCWPVGGPIQGPLHVLRDMIRAHGLKAGDVEKVVARIPDKELEIVNNRDMPNISIRHLLALMLLDGTLTSASAHDFTRMKDPKVLALKARIEAVGDPALTDPQRRWRCVMEVTLKEGRILAHQTMAAKGSYENPVTRADEEEKALDLMGPLLGRRGAANLIAAIWDLDRINDICVLRKLYRK
jgi:2-methylcitrate dehydratase PrpD